MRVPPSDHLHQPVTLVARNPRDALRRAEEELCANPGPQARSTALRLMGLARRELGDTESAHRLLRRSAAVADRAGLTESAAHARVSHLGLRALNGGGGIAGDSLGRMAAKTDSTRALILVHQGVAAAQRGRFGTAVADFDAARQLLSPRTEERVLAGLLSNRGLALMYSGRLPEAGADLRHALALAQEHSLEYLRGVTLQNLGCLAVRNGDIAQAVSRFTNADQLVPASRKAALHLDHAEALLTAGMSREAAVLLGAASARADAPTSEEATARLLKAKIHLSRGEHEAAAAQARRVRAGFAPESLWARLARRLEKVATPLSEQGIPLSPAGRRTGGSRTGADFLPSLSGTGPVPDRPVPGETPDAASTAAEGADRVLTHCVTETPLGPPSLVDPDPRHRVALDALATHDHDGAHRALLRTSGRAGSPCPTRHLELRVHARAQEREVAGTGARIALRAGDAATALEWIEHGRTLPAGPGRCRDDTWGRLLERCRAVHARASTGEESALDELRRLASRLSTAQWHHGCSPGADGTPGTAESVTAGLAAALGERAFVCFTRTGHGAAAVTVVDGAVTAHELAPAADIADAVAKLLHAARSAVLAPRDREGDTSRPAALVERLLLAPLSAAVGTRPLVIAPASYARDLPWGLLPGLKGRESTVVPSGRVWLDCRSRALRQDRRPRRVLLAAGGELAGAAAEIESLHPHYPEATVLTGPDARVPDVLRELGRSDIAHLSAHGSAPPDMPMLSGLSLADGPLYAYDMERLPRSPALTVLSSCWLGRCSPSPSEYPLGLSPSLMAMGGATVVASVLPVSDGETSPAMLRFHTALALGTLPAQAVAEHLADAGFVCFGAG